MCRLNVIWQKLCLYCAHKVLQTKTYIWAWPLTRSTIINRLPPFIINNLHMQFESNWVKTVACMALIRRKWDRIMHSPTHLPIHQLTHPTTNKRPYHYVPSNAVARRWVWVIGSKVNFRFYTLSLKQRLFISLQRRWRGHSNMAVRYLCFKVFISKKIAKSEVYFWPYDSNSIWFLVSSGTNYKWN